MAQSDAFEAGSIRAGIGRKSVRGVAFVGASQALGIVTKLAAIPLLARLLDPSDFGLMGVALSIGAFAAMLADAGISTSTVSAPEITRQQVANLFWVAVGLGLAAAALFAALAVPLASLFGDERLTGVLLAYAPVFLLSALTVQPQALLRRGMQHRELAVIALVSQVAALGVAVWLAWHLRSYWALVAMQLTQSAVRAAGVWLFCSWRPTWPRPEPGTVGMVRFGSIMLGSSAINTAAAAVDRPLVAAAAGIAASGLYDRAFEVLVAPVRQLAEPVGSVLLPALSRLAESPEKYRQLYRYGMLGMFSLTSPLVAFLIVAPDLFVVALLGRDFADAVPLVRALSLSVGLLPICYSLSWVLVSQGRARDLFNWNVIDGVTRLAIVTVGAGWGAMGVAVAATLRMFLMMPVLFARVGTRGPLSSWILWELFGVKAAATCSGLAFAAAARVCLPATAPSWVAIAIIAMSAFVGSVGLLSCFPSYREAVGAIRFSLRHAAKPETV